MRTPVVAGNWKMNMTAEEADAFIDEFNPMMDAYSGRAKVLICPPSMLIRSTFRSVNKKVAVGAQNCHHETQGAFTGEHSATQLASVGASHVIIGHSERRHLFGEGDDWIAKKVEAAIHGGLTAILCCGELIDERREGKHMEVIANQLAYGMKHVGAGDLHQLIIAYEPVWAIGTGETATTEQAEEMHAHIRGLVQEKYGDDAASDMVILYGGSCNPDNAAALFACENVDGGLIGGASLKPDSFLKIIQAAG